MAAKKPPAIETMSAETAARPADVALQLRNVTKYYGDFKAVDGVSFTLPTGFIYGFLGPNGAGKTTTLRMILEIIKPTSGEITVLGHSSALQVRHRLGYLPEEKGLYKKMKTWAVIAYFATLKGLDRKTAKLRALELLERYGLKDFADKPTDALSKGIGQKVQMLASIAHDPELVILDEPFSGLDPVNQQVMEEIIRDLAARNHTVLFSTHVMQHAERLCDRVLLIAKGEKIFDGTIPQAKRALPRRVRIETEDDIAPLRQLPEVISLRLLESNHQAIASGPTHIAELPLPKREGRGEGEATLKLSIGRSSANGIVQWEMDLRENADPQAILQFCFDRKIRLRSFNQTEPTLHEVFVRLVGAEAKEAGFR
jgi:ABC-2 type transport system ATP-binding protein